MPGTFKKQMLVLTTSLLMTNASKKATLKCIPCIYYLVQFRKNKVNNLLVLIDWRSEINAMLPAYTKKLGFQIWKTNIKAQKIDGPILEIFEIVIVSF